VTNQIRTILWAQFRLLRNIYARGRGARTSVTLALAAIWYGLWAFGAVLTAVLLASAAVDDRLERLLAHGLLGVTLYWQLIPILTASGGASLDLRLLLPYPVPRRRLFIFEVLLRMTGSVEMLLVLSGGAAGLLVNPNLPWWAPAALVPFAGMNLLAAAGLRQLLSRLLARRYVREAAFLLLVILAALPQLVLFFGAPAPARAYLGSDPAPWWPWSASAMAVLGRGPWPWLTLAGWLALAWVFGRRQFERSLKFDFAAAEGRRGIGVLTACFNRISRLPSLAFRDPLAALVEKELRCLARSPRFRVVAIMGFTFGLIIWLPLAVHGPAQAGFFARHYLTFVSLYALLLLGEVSFWNSFGFDRAAARWYYLAPGEMSPVLVAKNITAVTAVCVELAAIAIVCSLLRMPLSPGQVLEAYAVTLVLSLYLLAGGNLASSRFPRPVDPRQAWRTAAGGRFQAMLLFLYPLLAAPVGLAYLGRYLFESEAVFWGTLAGAAVLGAAAYRSALRSATALLVRERERFLEALAAGPALIST